jgi:putative intracellular protease/amidase
VVQNTHYTPDVVHQQQPAPTQEIVEHRPVPPAPIASVDAGKPKTIGEALALGMGLGNKKSSQPAQPPIHVRVADSHVAGSLQDDMSRMQGGVPSAQKLHKNDLMYAKEALDRITNLKDLITNKKILIAIPPEQFNASELNSAKRVIVNAGGQVNVASTYLTDAKSIEGESFALDHLISMVDPNEYQAIVIIGGSDNAATRGSEITEKYLTQDYHLLRILQQMNQEGKVITAVGSGSQVLARAGVLSGKQVTTSPTADTQALIDQHAIYIAEPLVQDNRLITCDGPNSVSELAALLVSELIDKNEDVASIDSFPRSPE